MHEESVHTKVTGSISHPHLPNIMNVVFNSAFRLLNLQYSHIPFDVHPRNLETALRGIAALNIQGITVNHPHCESVIEYLDEVNGEASTIRLVNTIVNDGDRLIGYNTNIFAINEVLKPFKEELIEKQISMFGAGNIAKTVLYTLIKNYRPKSIFLFNRDQQRAEKLKRFVRDDLNFTAIKVIPFLYDDILNNNEKSKLIINATSIGMPPKTEESIIEKVDILRDDQIVFDLVYSQKDTKLIQLAKSKNLRTISGIEVLLNQASKSFELWINKNMPIDEVRKIISQVH
jgi:shikimate dehydrogenase